MPAHFSGTTRSVLACRRSSGGLILNSRMTNLPRWVGTPFHIIVSSFIMRSRSSSESSPSQPTCLPFLTRIGLCTGRTTFSALKSALSSASASAALLLVLTWMYLVSRSFCCALASLVSLAVSLAASLAVNSDFSSMRTFFLGDLCVCVTASSSPELAGCLRDVLATGVARAGD